MQKSSNRQTKPSFHNKTIESLKKSEPTIKAQVPKTQGAEKRSGG